MQFELLLAISQRMQNSALVLGILGIVSGLLLMKWHQAVFQRHERQVSTIGTQNYEARKLRRRTVVAALVTSVGCMLAAMYWVRELKVLAILTLLIIFQLVGILVLAIIDFLFASIRNLTRPNPQRQREILEEILKQREHARESESAPDANDR